MAAAETSFFSLPSYGSTVIPNNYVETGQQTYSGNSGYTGNYNQDRAAFYENKDPYTVPIKELFVDSQSEETGQWMSSIWDWAKTEQGSSVLGGAVSGAGEVWAANKQEDLLNQSSKDAKNLAQMKIDAEMAMQEKELAQQMEIAMLAEKRINRHNKSINAPVNMSLRSFK